MRAVLLGGSGFVGAHLSRALSAAGYDVAVYDYRMPPLAPRWPSVRYILGDLFGSEPPGLSDVLNQADLVYHLAWNLLPATSNEQPIHDVETNLFGLLRILDLCVKVGVRRVIFFSSGGTVYGPAQMLPIPETHPTEPRSSHAINKLMAEKYLALYGQLHSLDYVILRPGNPYGPYQDPRSGQGVIAAFLSRVASGQPLEVWGDGSAVRDYFYVGDLARAAMLAGETPHSRTVYNIGSGVGRSLHDVIASIRRLVGHDVPVTWRPGRPVDVPTNILDASKARSLLGWSPEVTFEEGLRRTWSYYAGLNWAV